MNTYIFKLFLISIVPFMSCSSSDDNSNANNLPPIVVNPIQDIRIAQNQPVNINISSENFEDPNGDLLTYTITFSQDIGLVDNGDGIIGGTPTSIGLVNATIIANDGNGGQVSESFNIEVLSFPFNLIDLLIYIPYLMCLKR